MVLEKNFTSHLDHQKEKVGMLKQIKMSLEAKMTILKLFYFRHIMRRQDYLENIIMEEKMQHEKRKIKFEINSIK